MNCPSTRYKKQQRQRGAILAAALLLFLIVMTFFTYEVLHHQLHEERQQVQMQELSGMQQALLESLKPVGTDLMYLSHSGLPEALLNSSQAGMDQYLAIFLAAMGQLNPYYDQLRVLDGKGNEVFRLNRQPDGTMAEVPKHQLQNKSDRYYFKETRRLQPNQVYTSRFDLNIEQGVLELPLKPMIRFGTPIYGPAGQFLGAALINYQGIYLHQLLNELNVHEGDQVYLVNQEGYYLKSHDSSMEWGFAIKERSQHRFALHFPGVWEEVLHQPQGTYRSKHGEFYFVSFKLIPPGPFQVLNGQTVSLIMRVPDSIVHQEDNYLIQGLSIGFVSIAPLLIFLGWAIGHYQIRQKWLLRQLTYDANHDELTGLYNRKAVLERLEQSMLLAKRNQTQLAVSFIDVNDLKPTNDEYGHEAGDQLLKAAADTIQEEIRSSDIAARIGGDEFLIVFPYCDQAAAHQVMLRIEELFSERGKKQANRFWSLSYGSTQLVGEQDTVDQMIERADQLMYQHKLLHKQSRQDKMEKSSSTMTMPGL